MWGPAFLTAAMPCFYCCLNASIVLKITSLSVSSGWPTDTSQGGCRFILLLWSGVSLPPGEDTAYNHLVQLGGIIGPLSHKIVISDVLSNHLRRCYSL